MKTYTFTQAREKLAALLDEAAQHGEVRIQRRSGDVFIIKLLRNKSSGLNVKGLKIGLDRDEILQSIREGRKEYK